MRKGSRVCGLWKGAVADMKFDLKKTKWTKQKTMITVAGALVIAVVFGAFAAAGSGSKADYVYKETQVKFGTLTVGVSESGVVDIGTVEQTFDLDMSALQRVETGSSGSNSGAGMGGGAGGTAMGGNAFGGMAGGAGAGGAAGSMGGLDMFSQILGMGSNNLTAVGDASSLTVAGVKVSVGQQVAQGDVLYELEEESVWELEQELQANVEKAKADLDAVYADQALSKQTAEYTYKSSLEYGSYAETEYNEAIRDLQNAVEEAQITLDRARESLSSYQSQLESMTTSYNDALKVLENSRYSLEHTDQSVETYLYVYYFEQTKEAQSLVDSLEQKKEQLERNVEQAQSNVETAQKSLSSVRRNQEQGKLSAKQTYALRNLAYNTAQETYDIALAYLEEDAAAQESIYQETQEKWEEFSSHINGNTVCSQYDGVITSVELAEGDSINTGSVLVTLYNLEDVSMTVTLYEEDMTDIALGSAAVISFTAYPDQLFEAEVTEISDASTDSKGNVIYEVTATIQGDVSGLFQGMTGEITFVTERSEDALYVSRRAIITENDKSYVKVRDEGGHIKKIEITTGFSDGTYVQILEGLSEGDTVLIESKVSGS